MDHVGHEEILSLLRSKQGKKSLRAFGEEIGCSAAYLSDVYRGLRYPGPKILRFLGVTKNVTVTYSKRKRTK